MTEDFDLPDEGAPIEDYPRIYIKNRAYRLSRLAELGAPVQIVENEFWLLTTAIQALRMKAVREETDDER